MLHKALASKVPAERALLAATFLSPNASAAFLRPTGTRGHAGRGGSESEEAARSAANDLSEAVRDSVKHAAEGDVGAAVQDAARMAHAGARGAAQAARLVFEQARGQAASSGAPPPAGSAGDRAATAASEAAAAAASGASRTMDSMSERAAAAYKQTVGSMGGKTVQEDAKGDWVGVMVQSAAEEAGAVGGEGVGDMPKGSGAGGAGFAGPSGAGGAGFAGPSVGVGGAASGAPGGPSEKSFAEDEFAVEGGDKRSAGNTSASAGGTEGSKQGRAGSASAAASGVEGGGQGGGGRRVSERSAQDDEFGVTKGV
ncbi:hypothetical protein ABPG77_003659 [Micractinium sp. CCAP 211/92]